jgi:hypothetical protein
MENVQSASGDALEGAPTALGAPESGHVRGLSLYENVPSNGKRALLTGITGELLLELRLEYFTREF